MQSSAPQSVTSRVAKGAAWIFGFKILERSLGFVSTLILARLLVPEDFGIVAMATSLMAIIEMLTAFNFEAALIQKQAPTRADYSAAWTLNVILGVGSAIVMVALAHPLASFFREPGLVPVVFALSLVPIAQSAYNIWLTEYRKKLQFRPDFVYQASKKIGGFLLTVPLALWMGSYWALIVGMVGSQVIGTVMSYRLHASRPRLSLAGSRALLNFSTWTMIGNVLTTARVRASHFVLGRLGGPGSLGIFTMANDISTLPTTELVMPINRAVFPAYASMAENPVALRMAYIAVIGMVALAITPAAVGLIAVAPLAVPLLLGPAWLGVVPLVPALASYGLSISLQTNSSSVYWALGRPKLGAATSGLMLLVLLLLIIPLTSAQGSKGAATACLISGAVTLPVTFWLMARLLGLRPRDFLACLWRPTVGAAVMLLVVKAFLAAAAMEGATSASWASLGGAVILGAAVYVSCIVILWLLSGRPQGAERFAADKVRQAIQTRRERSMQ